MGSREAVSVFVGEDHPTYLEGLVRALARRPDLEVVGAASDGREALARIRALRPAVAVLDENMPGLLGSDVLQAISREGLPTRVVILSASLDDAAKAGAVAGGAHAYLAKDAGRGTICDAVAAVARGETVPAPETGGGLSE